MDVKAVIKEKGFTLTECAEKIGITRVTLMQNLQSNPSQRTLQRIADAIGCKVVDFYKDELPENSPVQGYVEINKVIHKITSMDDLKELVAKYSKEL